VSIHAHSLSRSICGDVMLHTFVKSLTMYISTGQQEIEYLFYLYFIYFYFSKTFLLEGKRQPPWFKTKYIVSLGKLQQRRHIIHTCNPSTIGVEYILEIVVSCYLLLYHVATVFVALVPCVPGVCQLVLWLLDINEQHRQRLVYPNISILFLLCRDQSDQSGRSHHITVFSSYFFLNFFAALHLSQQFRLRDNCFRAWLAHKRTHLHSLSSTRGAGLRRASLSAAAECVLLMVLVCAVWLGCVLACMLAYLRSYPVVVLPELALVGWPVLFCLTETRACLHAAHWPVLLWCIGLVGCLWVGFQSG
jgi:hypothetical protein